MRTTELRLYRTLSRALAVLPPGLGEFRYANLIYRHRMKRHRDGSGVRAALEGRARFELDLSQWPEAQAFLLRRYAPDLVHFIVEQLTGEEAVFLDVGAHVGLVTFQVGALSTARDLWIHAFEPHPDAARRFRVNQALNPRVRVRVNECAVSASPGSVKFGLEAYAIEEDVRDGNVLDVPAVTLDDYFDAAEIRYADVVKIDVEGHELAVLKGAARVLAEGRIGHVVVEMLDAYHERFGRTREEVAALMLAHGFTPRRLPPVGARRIRLSRRRRHPSSDVVFARVLARAA